MAWKRLKQKRLQNLLLMKDLLAIVKRVHFTATPKNSLLFKLLLEEWRSGPLPF